MSGHRGYVASRPLYCGERTPQHVQNIVLRDYARRRGLTYLLSAVEYAMPGCFQVLESVFDELLHLDGILGYSLFMLPEDDTRRRAVYNRILAERKSLHFAVEDLALESADDIERLETLWLVRKLLKRISDQQK